MPHLIPRPAAGHEAGRASLSQRLSTIRDVTDEDQLPQRGRVVLAILKDGRQLEGELIVLSGRYQVGDVTFFEWEIEELEEIPL